MKSKATYKNMHTRCYNAGYQKTQPTYIGVEVDERFHSFEVFKQWYSETLNAGREGYELDKDVLGDGKLYSPETCAFIPREINRLLKAYYKGTDKLKQGVIKENSKYLARLYSNGKSQRLGLFSTEDEAHAAYLVAKKQNITRLAEKYRFDIEERVYRKLMAWEV